MQLGLHVRRRVGIVLAPHDHRHRADLAFRDPAQVVLEEPRGDARRLAQVAVSHDRVLVVVRSRMRRADAGPPPSSKRRTRAEPTITPSACSHSAVACVGGRHADAHEHRLVRHRLQPLGDDERRLRQRVALAGDTEQPDAVHEAPRRAHRREEGARRAWSARPASRSRPRRRRRRAPGAGFLEGKVGQDRGVDAGVDERAREALVAHVERDVVVRHHRNAGCRRRASRARRGWMRRRARVERALARLVG